MLYLILTIISSALVSILMRLSGSRVKDNIAMLAVNYLMCGVVAAVYADFSLLPGVTGIGGAGLMGGINGLLYLGSFMLLQINVQRNGVVLSSTFMKLGLLVSILTSVLFFGELPNGMQIVGFVIAVGAIVLINYDREAKGTAGFKLGLFLLMLSGGAGDTMAKVFEELGNPVLEPQFLFYTFAMALVLCVVLMGLKKQRPGKWEVLFGLLVGIPNYFSAKFLLGALETLPAVIVYPVYSVGSILVVTLAGVLLFRERLEKRQWIGLAAILTALVLLNL